MSKILLPWEKQGPAYIRPIYIRQIHGKPYWNYGWIISDDSDRVQKWLYHAIKSDNTNIFKSVGAGNSDYASTLEEAKQIVDEALIVSGWILLNDDDKFSKLKALL